jgi:hypothetical protein
MGVQLLVESLCEADLGEFRGAIDSLAGKAVHAGHGRNHQHETLALLDHDGNDMPSERESGADIHVHHFDVVVETCVDELLVVAYADILDENVDAAKR